MSKLNEPIQSAMKQVSHEHSPTGARTNAVSIKYKPVRLKEKQGLTCIQS